MINLTQQEYDILHCKHGAREEHYKLELLDYYGIKKCDLDLVDGSINVDNNADIHRYGNIVFNIPNKTRRTPKTLTNVEIVVVSTNGSKFAIGIESSGFLYTLPYNEVSANVVTTKVRVQDDGVLFTENISTASVEFELIDNEGYTWQVGIESTGEIFSQRTDNPQKIVYYDEKIEIDWLNDKVKAYMGIKTNCDIKWYPLGVFLLIKPRINKGVCTCQVYDETMFVQQDKLQAPKLFLQGTNYGEVLRYFLISCGITKINIQPTTLTLNSDVVCDYTKNKLDWFNYFAEQINYTKLYTDSNGWFTSKKYIEPSPLNVSNIYENNQISVLVGEIDTVMDYWQIPNVFVRIVANPQVGELVSTYENNNASSKFSIVRRNGKKITDIQTIDNVANQIELDNLVRKLAFNSIQVEQEVQFSTLNMPTHSIGDVLDLRSDDLRGIFTEQRYSIQLKSGGKMSHTAKRLVRLN